MELTTGCYEVRFLLFANAQGGLDTINCHATCPVPQGPHSHILMTGVSDRGSYFIPQKITISEFVYPKKSLLYLAYPKNSLSPFFARPPKNPSVFFFRDPKKFRRLSQTQKDHFWPKFQTQKSHSDPPPPPPPSLKYVSGAPGPGSRHSSCIKCRRFIREGCSRLELTRTLFVNSYTPSINSPYVKFVETKSTELVLKIN